MKKQLMLSLLSSIVLSCAVIAGGVWFYSDQISQQLIQFNIDSTSKQISIIIRQYDKIFGSFQTELNREARKTIIDVAAEVGNDYQRHTPAYLKGIAVKYGCDEIYFIDRTGKIANSSFVPDLKLDLFTVGIFFENFLRNIYGKGVVFSPMASIGMKTGVINKYVYYSPEKSDYILEISYNLRRYISRHYASSYYEFLSLQKINELTVDNQLLINIDLITSIGTGRSWSLLNTGREVNIPKRIIQQAMKDGRVSINNGETLTLYIDATQTQERGNIYNDDLCINPRILILTYNLTVVDKYRHNLLLFLIVACLIASIGSFLVVSEYLNHKFLRRIMTINSGLSNIARGQYGDAINVDGHDELTMIAGNINKMASEIQGREDDLKNSEKRFRSIFEHAPLGIIIIGLDRRIHYSNTAIVKMLQYSHDELENLDFLPLLAKEDISKSLRNFTSVVKGEIASYVTERKIIRKDGFTVLASITVASVKDDNDIPVYIIAIINDITESHQIEQQFFQAQKLDAIGKLAGGVAHDFNNLLQVIMGYSKMLEKYLHEPKSLEIWSNVVQAGEKARNLVRRLLSLGRSDQGGERKNIAIAPLLQEFVKMLGRVLGENIEVVVHAEEQIPPIHADQGQVEQVLMNLCVNARDAMPGGGTLTIAIAKRYLNEEKAAHYPDVKPGFFAGFSIADTGLGMSEEVKKHIFEPFFTTKEQGKGTGIGLATVYVIVKSHGGFIELESTPGVGTIVRILFPAAEGFIADASNSELEKPSNDYAGHGEVILICEDEQQVRTLAQMMLEEAGYRVLVACDGEEGIQVFDRHKETISLVILDVIMPKRSGRQVFRHIRGITTEMPVLFTTGYSQEMLGQEFGSAVIQKPYNEDTLLKKTREMIDEANHDR